VKIQVTDASDGLNWFQFFKPPGMKGQTLLDHMLDPRQISFKTQEKELYAPNAHLDIAMKPCNVKILKHMTAPDLSKSSGMQDCACNVATINLVTRKLNQTGYIQRHFGLGNTEDKVQKLTKITKKEISSIIFSVFLILEEEKNKK
jgi:hypothetical protein